MSEESIHTLITAGTWLLGVVLVSLMFKKSITGFIDRTKSISKSGIDLHSPSPLKQRTEKIDENEIQPSINELVPTQYTFQVNFEERYNEWFEDDEVEPEKKCEILLRHFSITAADFHNSTIYYQIFGSQIRLLKKLNSSRELGIKVTEVEAYVQNVFLEHNQLFTWEVEDYMAILSYHALISKIMDGVETESWHITELGIDFLKWIVLNAKTEEKDF